jgi:hypothetical protein
MQPAAKLSAIRSRRLGDWLLSESTWSGIVEHASTATTNLIRNATAAGPYTMSNVMPGLHCRAP